MARYQNFLIIQPAFIGDAILASSLAEKLHSRFPSAQISLLVRKGNEGVYRDHPFLKEVLVWDKTSKKYRNLFSLLKAIRKRKFDCVINCHRYASSGFLTAFSGARHKAGYKQTPFSYLFDTAVKHVIGNGKHETERYSELTQDFAGTDVFKPRLYPSEANWQKISSLLTPSFVCMAPASVWFTKQLSEAKWVELCKRMNPETTVYLLGAPSDKELCERIRARSGNPSVKVLAGALDLLDSCALMSRARMNYVNDSAPLHLASSVNAPVTAFFCSTVPSFGFGPLSDNAEVIQVENLECKPCGLHGYRACPLGHFRCSEEIRMDLVKTF